LTQTNIYLKALRDCISEFEAEIRDLGLRMTSRSIWPRKSLVPHAHASTVPTTWSAGKLGQTDAGADTDAVEEDEQHESLETNTLVGWDELCEY
jgi:hypothetical protein